VQGGIDRRAVASDSAYVIADYGISLPFTCLVSARDEKCNQGNIGGFEFDQALLSSGQYLFRVVMKNGKNTY
jgi:hypothetical protein